MLHTKRNWYEESSVSDGVTDCIERARCVYDIKCFFEYGLWCESFLEKFRKSVHKD